ncbi:MAG: tRNA lysidine(34) synthetase TilS [Wenzhouxiangellaceae bacterium]
MKPSLRIDSEAVSRARTNYLAFSGGPDSMCLLHCLLHAGPACRLEVIHVDHGLDRQSAERADRARLLAGELGVECRIVRLAIEDHDGGPEAAARRARYACFESMLAPGEFLLTAHHADDQIETVLLRLLRGAGPRGLAGMRARRRLGAGWLGRPLLGWSREQIMDYLDRHALDWIEDPTNRDTALDRNFLRHEILPNIATRWPGYRASILRAAHWQRAAGHAVERDAAACWQDLHEQRPGSGEITLALPAWLEQEPARAFAALRWWCERRGLAAPPIRRLEVFRQQAAQMADDRQPRLDWSGARLHAWRRRIWLDAPILPERDWSLDWDPSTPARPPAGGSLLLRKAGGQDFGRHWRLQSAPGGVRLRTDPGGPSRSVVELLRLAGIPPWRRQAVPVLVIDGIARAVGPDWLDHEFRGWLDDHDAALVWQQRPATLLPCPQSPETSNP